MKKIQTFIYVLLMGFAFAACQDDSLGGTEQGGIRIALTDGTAGVDVTTRSTPSELFDGFKQKFKFQIKGGDNYDQTHDWTKDVIPLAAGVYDITATCGTEQADGLVEFDKPCYTGTKEGLKVNAGETATTAEISCKVTNALVSLKFVEENEADFADAYAMIAVGTGAETRWDPLTKSAYFKAGSSLSKLTIFKDGSDSKGADILTDAQKDANFPKTFAAGDHLILTLSIAKANGNAVIKVSKVEIQKVTISETIPLEWLPKPKVGATGFDDNNTLTFAETETKEAKLNLDLASALQDIKFKFDFEDEQFSFEDREYLLSTDKETIEQALGITLPAIGATEASIDFSGLVAKLQSKVDGATINKIMIVPKANDRWSSEKTDVDSVYTFTCNKPEFSIAVQEGNVWTKIFTIDEPTVTAGDAETIKSKLKYQYKTENGEWQDCEQLVQFDSAPDEKNYQVRAIYREAIASEEVAVTLETPAQLPNSGMEEWSTRELGSWGWFDKTRYYGFYPYNNGEQNIWWATNNERSQDGNIVAGIGDHVAFSPCVSYSETIKHTGSRSALVYTSGHGGGYISSAIKIYPEGAIAGNLFIGNYLWSDKTETITAGHSFTVRPTSFKFWYKYVPKNSDTFKVYIELKNGDEVIASGTFIPQTISSETDWIEASIDLDYGDSPKTATSIYVQFLSTTKTSFSESDFDQNKSITFPVMGDWNAHIGSMLYIDDLSLIYDK